jgi:DNA-binding CsgD family transcriptional regulator
MKHELGNETSGARALPLEGEPRPVEHLSRAREAFQHNAWRDAYEAYLAADAAAPLSGDDLDGLAVATLLVGGDADFMACKARSYHANLAAQRARCAARDAFWLALFSLFRGDVGQANAWVARGEKLVGDTDCAELGLLRLVVLEQALRGGGAAAAHEQLTALVALGERCGDADLHAPARHMQGRAAIELGEVARGLKLLDETMLSVVAGELSPIMTGLMYCSVIDACRGVHEWSRAREWTAALSRWCDRQAGLVSFTDICFVHRAEILCLQGAWQEALRETQRVCARGEHSERPPPGAAFYQQGEIHRLRGESSEAERCYRAASRRGFEPYPGLALLRLAQGRADAAVAATRRLIGAEQSPRARGRLLPAHVEIMLAVGDLEEACRGCQELETLCATFDSELMRAQAAHLRGAWCARREDPVAALGHLREAFACWGRFDAPYEAARTRMLIADACAALGDAEACALELDAARATFEQLGARHDLERLDLRRPPAPATNGLTTRELQVLKLVARGRTNKEIGRELALSERTVDRHVSNILAKLDVPTRAAATAHAVANGLT